MPVTPTYPGVYIEEIPSGVRTITGVATSIAAFIDFFKRGPMNKAVQILSMTDFERELGGLDARSEASYAIHQFFLNGGTEVYVVRVASGTPRKAAAVILDAVGGATALNLSAANEGVWGNNLRIGVDYGTTDPTTRFNLTVSELGISNGRIVILRQETFRNLSMSPTLPAPAPSNTPDPNYVKTVINAGSSLVTVDDPLGASRPLSSGTVSGNTFTFPATPPGAGQPLRVNVTFTIGASVETRAANLGTGDINTLEEAAIRLEAAIRGAKPDNAAWAQTIVRVAAGVLQIGAGPAAPHAIITFGGAPAAPPLAADPNTFTNLDLPVVAGAGTNVAYYQVGYATAVAVGAQAAGAAASAGDDGTPPDATALIGNPAADPPTGIHSLEKVDLFNILCIPRIARVSGVPDAFSSAQHDPIVSAATAYCEKRRAFLILDTPSDVTNISQIKNWITQKATLRHKNVALYFPRVRYADPLDGFRMRSFGASGTMAGLYARTDVQRGVWKAPAGTEAVLRNVQEFDYKMTDAENGAINPLGINAVRFFDIYGNVCWGARTLDGSDQQASEWKYIPVRRLALLIEESLYRGTKWVVFEPNDEPLWAQIRLNIGAFMHTLFRQGAFQGQTPREAYFVKCDKETTTQTDINLGIVNIVVGFAPLKPAEFVIIKIQQMAGQIQT